MTLTALIFAVAQQLCSDLHWNGAKCKQETPRLCVCATVICDMRVICSARCAAENGRRNGMPRTYIPARILEDLRTEGDSNLLIPLKLGRALLSSKQENRESRVPNERLSSILGHGSPDDSSKGISRRGLMSTFSCCHTSISGVCCANTHRRREMWKDETRKKQCVKWIIIKSALCVYTQKGRNCGIALQFNKYSAWMRIYIKRFVYITIARVYIYIFIDRFHFCLLYYLLKSQFIEWIAQMCNFRGMNRLPDICVICRTIEVG